jgi:hypothetical protein
MGVPFLKNKSLNLNFSKERVKMKKFLRLHMTTIGFRNETFLIQTLQKNETRDGPMVEWVIPLAPPLDMYNFPLVLISNVDVKLKYVRSEIRNKLDF